MYRRLIGPELARLAEEQARQAERITWLDRLTDEKFVKHGSMLMSEAEQVKLALDASKEAIDKAERSTQKAIDRTAEDIATRFASVNEFRAQLSDQVATFMPRREAEQLVRALSDKLEAGREQVVQGDAKLDERLKALERGQANQQGRTAMVGVLLAVVVVAVNIAIALLTR